MMKYYNVDKLFIQFIVFLLLMLVSSPLQALDATDINQAIRDKGRQMDCRGNVCLETLARGNKAPPYADRVQKVRPAGQILSVFKFEKEIAFLAVDRCVAHLIHNHQR